MSRTTFEGKRYPLTEGESVLEALVRGGADVRFSCKKGTCHACLLKVTQGDPGAESTRSLRSELVRRGYFLPCQSRPPRDLEVTRPDHSELLVRARVEAHEMLSSDVARLLLEPETHMDFRAGQYVNVTAPGGEVRSYSIASVQREDYYLELHVKRIGVVSTWLVDTVRAGDEISVQGPMGRTVYDESDQDRPMLMLCTGTGLSPLVGVVRDALAAGHRGRIDLYYGSRHVEGLYLRTALERLAAANPTLHLFPCVTAMSDSDVARAGVFCGRVVEAAFATHIGLGGTSVFLAGHPAMVEEARILAFERGAARDRIVCDPFEFVHPFVPKDAEKLRSIPPDPELWDALERGKKLRAILEDFYTEVFEDPRLFPFFHRVTKARAIDKQYEFLADIFGGTKHYFGLRPFNAHHWMVISDELFDYRERLIEACMRRHGLSEHLIRRFLTVHERFRRDIVKGAPRGLIVDGKEHPVLGYAEEKISVGSLCDGCEGEMPAGSMGRIELRTGALYCTSCAARRVGATLPPPPPVA